MSEQKKQSESSTYNNPFLRQDAPPVIEDPYSVPIEEINPIDGRLFQMDIHEAHF